MSYTSSPSSAQAGDTHAFKNFHRLLCERFDYCHDEKDWRRDQASLIEHIARRISSAPAESGWQPMAPLEEELFSAADEALELTRLHGGPQLPRLFEAVRAIQCNRSGG